MRLIAAFIALLLASPAAACGPDTDCTVGDRTYRLYVPPDAAAPVGALLFAHGYRGSAAGVMRNAALRRLADVTGLALVALESAGNDWSLAHRPAEPGQKEAREYTYVAAVLADLADRVALDDSRLVMSGFSAGGMMTWAIACNMSDRFAGFVPMSGTFWAPVPATCPAPPANIVHIHGTKDGTVPLQGRTIGPARQGDVEEALGMYANKGAFTIAASRRAAPDDTLCRRGSNPDNKLLEFCTFAGGHSFSTARLRYGIDRVLGSP